MKHRIRFLVAALLFALAPQARGDGWKQQTSPTTLALYGVAFSDPNTWVAVGDLGTILRSTDGGVGWMAVSSPVGDQLRGISFNGSTGLAVGIAGRVLRSTDAGATWTEETRPTHSSLYSVSFGSHMAVITGEEGGIFVSTDGGLTWVQHFAGTASVLFGVSVSGNTGVGVGGRGAIVMSVDGGAGWGLTILNPDQVAFYATSFVNSVTGWAVGSYIPTGSLILRSDQSGFTWNAQTTPTTNILFGVSFADINAGTAVGASGTVIHTTDGGQLWSLQSSGVTQSLNAVSFATSDFGITVGDQGTILRTISGGVSAVGNPGADPQSAEGLSLEQNSPNPFSSQTAIRFTLPRRESASLKVFNIAGEEVATLVAGEVMPGLHVASWNGSRLPRGVYFARLQTGESVETRKMILK